MPKTEAKRFQVVPVFTEHTNNLRKLIEFRKIIEGGGSWPNQWMYPRSTAKRLIQLQPELIAVDGLYPAIDAQRMLFFSPGNPLDLQPTTFVAADLPVSQFMGKNPRASFTEQVLRNYWSRTIRGNSEDPNQVNMLTRWRSYAKYVIPEFAALYLLDRVVNHITGGHSTADLATTVAMYGDIARFYVNRNSLRRVSHLMSPELFIKLSRASKPIFFPTEDIDVRNATTLIKLADSFERRGSQIEQPRGAVVWGIHHANGIDLWNDPNKQIAVVTDAIVKVHKTAEKLASKMGISLDGDERKKLQKGVERFFAQITLWSLKSTPRVETIRNIRKQLQKESFNSPTLENIIRDVFSNS